VVSRSRFVMGFGVVTRFTFVYGSGYETGSRFVKRFESVTLWIQIRSFFTVTFPIAANRALYYCELLNLPRNFLRSANVAV
jgi:hypothetical protein